MKSLSTPVISFSLPFILHLTLFTSSVSYLLRASSYQLVSRLSVCIRKVYKVLCCRPFRLPSFHLHFLFFLKHSYFHPLPVLITNLSFTCQFLSARISLVCLYPKSLSTPIVASSFYFLPFTYISFPFLCMIFIISLFLLSARIPPVDIGMPDLYRIFPSPLLTLSLSFSSHAASYKPPTDVSFLPTPFI